MSSATVAAKSSSSSVYVSPDGKKSAKCTCWWDDPCFSHLYVIKSDWIKEAQK